MVVREHSQNKASLAGGQGSNPLIDDLCQDIRVAICIFPENLFDCFKSFFLTLGLPQVVCINNISHIPENCEEIIILSTDKNETLSYKRNIESLKKNINIWIPQLFPHTLCDAVEHYLKFEEKSDGFIVEKKVIIPKQLICETVPSKSSESFSLDNLFALSCKYAWRVFEKSSSIPLVDLLYGLYLAEQISKIDTNFSDALKKAIGHHIPYRKLAEEKEKFFEEEKDNFSRHDRELLNLIYSFQPEATKIPYTLIKSRILGNDATGVICCYGLIAHSYGYEDLYKLAYDKLIKKNYCHKASYILVKENSHSYYYRPLLALFLYIKCNERANVQKILGRQVCQLDWHLNLAADDSNVDIENLTSPSEKEYSISLILNTLIALTPFTCPMGQEFVINKSNYSPLYPLMQKIWFLLLKRIILSKTNLCIELLPWPDNKKYAVSLRYDVDRAVSSQRILALKDDIQYKWGSPCSSWYFFSAHDSKEEKRLLESFHHEIGLHSLGDCNVDEETGVTFHSGPSSNYWTGLKTHQGKVPLYIEFLQLQTSRPTIIFKGTNPFMVTPLHFPMELSTIQDPNSSNSKDLKIFFTEKIKEQMELGGHIILASHPDIEHNDMDFYLEKFSLKQGWCSPVDKVVKRIKDIYFNSFIKIYGNGCSYYINSEINLVNLTINLHYSDNFKKTQILDIKADKRKLIEES